MKSSHPAFQDDQFEALFRTAALDTALFDHEAHLRLAWIYLKKYRVEQAVANITFQLQNYVTMLGVSDKYNHTLTIASIKLLDNFIRKSRAQNFTAFTAEFPHLKSNFRDLINQHYKTDIFSSPFAHVNFLEPDILSFS